MSRAAQALTWDRTRDGFASVSNLPDWSISRGSRTQSCPETRFAAVGQPQGGLVGFVRRMAAIVVDAPAHGAKFEKIASSVSLRLGITASENGVEERPPNQSSRQKTTVRFCRLDQRGQESVVAAVEILAALDNDLVGNRMLIKSEQ